jgi:hypothetical protein
MGPLASLLQRVFAPPHFNTWLAAVLAVLFMAYIKSSAYLSLEIPLDRQNDCSAFGWAPSPFRRRVFDAFAFNSEYFALEARLHELDAVVDYFVVVEATLAFSGKQKPLFFAQDRNNSRWAPYLHKIIHVTLNDSYFDSVTLSPATAAVQRKIITKAGIIDGLDRAGAQPDDLVIFADLDEIPRAHVIDTLRNCVGYTLPVSIHTAQYIYDFGCPVSLPPYWERVRVAERWVPSFMSSLANTLTPCLVDGHPRLLPPRVRHGLPPPLSVSRLAPTRPLQAATAAGVCHVVVLCGADGRRVSRSPAGQPAAGHWAVLLEPPVHPVWGLAHVLLHEHRQDRGEAGVYLPH